MGQSDLSLRIFLPVYFGAYILIGGLLSVAACKRRYGIDPTVVAKPHPIMAMGETYRNIIFGAILLMVFLHAVRPPLIVYFVPIPFMQHAAVQAAGVVLLMGSLLLVMVSQRNLGASWRFDFDQAAEPPELVTTGLYAVSRNPIYVGMASTGVGLLLALPNAVTFAVANLTFLLLQVRVRVEEEYLLKAHGEAFEAYRRSTPRWLFRLVPED